MTNNQEIVKELFNEQIIGDAKKLFVSNNEIGNVKSELPLRLFKSKANTINLELIVQKRIETNTVTELGRMVKIFDYAQPIGYYTFQKGIFKTTVEITITKEFESSYDFLYQNNLVNRSYKVNKLSLMENILIGAVSIEATIKAELLADCSFCSNGFDYDLFMSSDNEYPQCYLDDKYNVQGPIIAYLFRKQNRPINPMIKYQESFNSLFNRSLLTAYKQFKR
jgi:hypothetical protein